MTRKPITLRTAVIVAAALGGGSTAGAIAEQLATGLGYHHPGPGQLATAVVTLWIIEKLHRLIDDERQARDDLQYGEPDRLVHGGDQPTGLRLRDQSVD